MSSRRSLVGAVAVLVTLLAVIEPPSVRVGSPPPAIAYEGYLQGTWALCRIEQAWVVTDQTDVWPGRSVARYGLPETWAVPARQPVAPVTITFTGGRYRTWEDGQVVARGSFRIDRTAEPAVFETRGETFHGQPEHRSPYRARITVEAGEVRLAVGGWGGRLPSGLRPTTEDEFVVVLRRL